MQKIILSIFLFSGIFLLAGCGNQPEITVDDSAIILFYGEECPHCKVVEKYITDNDIKSKITFTEKEVNHDKANANLMVKKQQECKLDEKAIGSVPFLWTAEKCYSGSDEIINFFKK